MAMEQTEAENTGNRLAELEEKWQQLTYQLEFENATLSNYGLLGFKNWKRRLLVGDNGSEDSHLERELAKAIAGSDEKLGAAALSKLLNSIKGLERNLGRLTNVSRDVVSSTDIVKSSKDLRLRLWTIRNLLWENACELFPRTFRSPTSPDGHAKKANWAELPTLFASLTKDVQSLIDCLEDFSEYTDEALIDTLKEFTDATKYISFVLNQHKDHFQYVAVRKYVQDVLERRFGEPTDDVTVSLTSFIDTGIRAVWSAQNQAATHQLALSTVATFFSAVTATTLQFSFGETSTILQVTVNSFWFCSLVFSIASVLNSLLAYMWENVLPRSPRTTPPKWMLNWILGSPLFFLIISAAAFSIGLCVFAYSSNQNHVTSTLTAVSTAVSSAGLVFVIIWLFWKTWVLDQNISPDVHPTMFRGDDDTKLNVANNGATIISFDNGARIDVLKWLIQNPRRWFSVLKIKRMFLKNRERVTERMDRVGRSLLMLTNMKASISLRAHGALVRHMQFSPDGDYLATCSWDRRVAIYDAKDFFKPPQILDHSDEKDLLSHLAWSPDGTKLLCKSLRRITIWTNQGDKVKSIACNGPVESVTWIPHGKAFLSVEGQSIRKFDLCGRQTDDYEFGPKFIHDVAVVRDGTSNLEPKRMICVASARTGNANTTSDRIEEMIFVYNLQSKCIESSVPVFGESRNVKLSMDGMCALVSFENKTPPQRWKIDYRHPEEKNNDEIAFLMLDKAYMPKWHVDFAGAGHFGGTFDELVVCSGKNGVIYVWDTMTGFLLHQFPTNLDAKSIGDDLTCLAWNRAPDLNAFQFTTGHRDGTVRVWMLRPRTERNEAVDISSRRPSATSGLPASPPSSPLHQKKFTFGSSVGQKAISEEGQ